MGGGGGSVFIRENTVLWPINDKTINELQLRSSLQLRFLDAELREAAHEVGPKANPGPSGSRYTVHV